MAVPQLSVLFDLLDLGVGGLEVVLQVCFDGLQTRDLRFFGLRLAGFVLLHFSWWLFGGG